MFGILIAALIYSVVNNQFLVVPQRLAGRVESAHTFGHPGRLQCRLDIEEIKGAYAVADALCERAYYGSAGEKNEWDTSLYGPTSPGPGSFNGSAVRFYDSGNPDEPDRVYDYLRPFDIQYIWNLENAAKEFTTARESGAPILSKPSWDSGSRKIWWSSTQLDDDYGAVMYNWSNIKLSSGIYDKSFIALMEYGLSQLGGGWYADAEDPGTSFIPVQFANQVSWNDMDFFFKNRSSEKMKYSLAQRVDMIVKGKKDKPSDVNYDGMVGNRMFGDEYLAQYDEDLPVQTNVSCLAGIGRLAAVLDRTYELAMPKVAEGGDGLGTYHQLTVDRHGDVMTSDVERVYGVLKLDVQSASQISAVVDFNGDFDEDRKKIKNPKRAVTKDGKNDVTRWTGHANSDRDQFRFEGSVMDVYSPLTVRFLDSGSVSSFSQYVVPDEIKNIEFAEGEREHTNVYFTLEVGYDAESGTFDIFRRNIRNDEGPLNTSYSSMGMNWAPTDLHNTEVGVYITSECEIGGYATWYWTDPVSESNIENSYNFAGPGAVAESKVLNSHSTQAGGIYVYDIQNTTRNIWTTIGIDTPIEEADLVDSAVITKYYKSTGWNDSRGVMGWVPAMAGFRANVKAQIDEYAQRAGVSPDAGGNVLFAKDGCLDPYQEYEIRGNYGVSAEMIGNAKDKECWLVIKEENDETKDELYFSEEDPIGMTNVWKAAYPMNIGISVSLNFVNDPRYTPTEIPKIRNDPYPFRAPWAADGRAATLIRTDWKWDGHTNRE